MEESDHQMSDDTNSRGVTVVVGGGGGGFLYGSPVLAPASGFHLQSGNYFDQSDSHQYPIVKTEAGTSQNRGPRFHHPSAIRGNQPALEHRRRPESDAVDAIKAKIVAHPQYSNLLEAYMNCQKVGAPPEVVARLTSVRQEFESRPRTTSESGNISRDPELDQFMEAYFDMLVKYREELWRPLQEAMEFMRRVETQLNVLTKGPVGISSAAEEKLECGNSSEEEQDKIGSGETGVVGMDPRAEDQELKSHLLKKYGGCLSNLKQELSKKRKKGKLPKDARQKLLTWWELHYKWPYPSESEKLALAESSGLDQKQINNWFINQRKRHWKPSEDMHIMVMDEFHHPNPAAAFYMDGHYFGNGP